MEDTLALMDMYYERMNACASTSGRRYNFKKMEELWKTSPIVRKVWEYVEGAFLIVERFVKRVINRIIPAEKRLASVEYNAPILPDGTEQLYFIRLLDANNNLVWSKIGTTSRRTDKRMEEHLRYYKKDGIAKIIVDEIFDCGDYPADMFESNFRGHYIKKHPGTWKKQDRFAGIELDLAEARELFEKWAA